MDPRVWHPVGSGTETRRVRDDRWARRCVRSAVEDDRRPDEYEVAVLSRAVRVPELGRMTVDVSIERLFAPVRHSHRASGREREQARVDLERHVLTRAERAADAGEHEMHLRFRQPEARRDLAQVLMQPLRSDMQLDAAVLSRNGKSSLWSESGLILHAELVLAGDDDFGGRVGIAVLDENVLDHVALLVKARGIRLQGGDRVGDRSEQLVSHRDRARCEPRLLRRLGGDDRDRLSDVAHAARREHRLVELHQTEQVAGRKLRGRDDGFHSAHLLGCRHVDRKDPRVGMRAAECGPKQHALATQVAAVLEFALYFRDAIGALDGLADASADFRARQGCAHRRYIAAEARSTASSIFP